MKIHKILMELQGTETRENIMKRIKFLLKGSEEEERWLNDYSRQGWELSNVGKYSYGFKKKRMPGMLILITH